MPDSQLVGILIAAMVAGVLLFRLYTVLGRRTGHEPQNDAALGNRAPSPLRDVHRAGAPDAQTLPPEGACARGLLDIELADPNFDRDRFLSGARVAYEVIQKAYGDADRLALRPQSCITAAAPQHRPALHSQSDITAAATRHLRALRSQSCITAWRCAALHTTAHPHIPQTLQPTIKFTRSVPPRQHCGTEIQRQ